MINGDFAQLGTFVQKTESYDFKAFFHANSEQFLVGQEAQVMIRTKLLINGQKTSASLLKNCKVTLQIQDYIGSPEISRTYSDLKFCDNEETIISFQVPPNLMQVSLTMTCDV
jgi:hypothetical protein